MKKAVKVILSLVLCCCMITPTVAFASEESKAYNPVQEYIEESQMDTGLLAKIQLAKVLNYLSNFVINDLLGTVLKFAIPDSAAVVDFEDFNLDEYDNFYSGMDTFIDEPQGDKGWSLGYGKASVLPADFGTKPYAKGAYLPYVFGNAM